jgi:3-hydroxyacyl-CoA dehydrogenase
MVNEAARILEEGIARDAGAVDLAMITGTGFPPFRGGLLRWADRRGTAAIVDRLEELAAVHGVRFQTSERMRRIAAGGGFYAAEA